MMKRVMMEGEALQREVLRSWLKDAQMERQTRESEAREAALKQQEAQKRVEQLMKRMMMEGEALQREVFRSWHGDAVAERQRRVAEAAQKELEQKQARARLEALMKRMMLEGEMLQREVLRSWLADVQEDKRMRKEEAERKEREATAARARVEAMMKRVMLEGQALQKEAMRAWAEDTRTEIEARKMEAVKKAAAQKRVEQMMKRVMLEGEALQREVLQAWLKDAQMERRTRESEAREAALRQQEAQKRVEQLMKRMMLEGEALQREVFRSWQSDTVMERQRREADAARKELEQAQARARLEAMMKQILLEGEMLLREVLRSWLTEIREEQRIRVETAQRKQQEEEAARERVNQMMKRVMLEGEALLREVVRSWAVEVVAAKARKQRAELEAAARRSRVEALLQQGLLQTEAVLRETFRFWVTHVGECRHERMLEEQQKQEASKRLELFMKRALLEGNTMLSEILRSWHTQVVADRRDLAAAERERELLENQRRARQKQLLKRMMAESLGAQHEVFRSWCQDVAVEKKRRVAEAELLAKVEAESKKRLQVMMRQMVQQDQALVGQCFSGWHELQAKAQKLRMVERCIPKADAAALQDLFSCWARGVLLEKHDRLLRVVEHQKDMIRSRQQKAVMQFSNRLAADTMTGVLALSLAAWRSQARESAQQQSASARREQAFERAVKALGCSHQRTLLKLVLGAWHPYTQERRLERSIRSDARAQHKGALMRRLMNEDAALLTTCIAQWMAVIEFQRRAAEIGELANQLAAQEAVASKARDALGQRAVVDRALTMAQVSLWCWRTHTLDLRLRRRIDFQRGEQANRAVAAMVVGQSKDLLRQSMATWKMKWITGRAEASAANVTRQMELQIKEGRVETVSSVLEQQAVAIHQGLLLRCFFAWGSSVPGGRLDPEAGESRAIRRAHKAAASSISRASALLDCGFMLGMWRQLVSQRRAATVRSAVREQVVDHGTKHQHLFLLAIVVQRWAQWCRDLGLRRQWSGRVSRGCDMRCLAAAYLAWAGCLSRGRRADAADLVLGRSQRAILLSDASLMMAIWRWAVVMARQLGSAEMLQKALQNTKASILSNRTARASLTVIFQAWVELQTQAAVARMADKLADAKTARAISHAAKLWRGTLRELYSLWAMWWRRSKAQRAVDAALRPSETHRNKQTLRSGFTGWVWVIHHTRVRQRWSRLTYTIEQYRDEREVLKAYVMECRAQLKAAQFQTESEQLQKDLATARSRLDNAWIRLVEKHR